MFFFLYFVYDLHFIYASYLPYNRINVLNFFSYCKVRLHWDFLLRTLWLGLENSDCQLTDTHSESCSLSLLLYSLYREISANLSCICHLSLLRWKACLKNFSLLQAYRLSYYNVIFFLIIKVCICLYKARAKKSQCERTFRRFFTIFPADGV